MARYPEHLVERVSFGNSDIIVRPIRPEDEAAHREFHDSLTDEDVRFRFFGLVRNPEHSQFVRFTRIDYEREMAFIAVDDGARTLGVSRVVKDADGQRAEFAVVVRSNIKGRGLGRILLEKLIDYCRATGVEELVGLVMERNTRMLALARDLGFRIGPMDEDGVREVVLDLGDDDQGTP